MSLLLPPPSPPLTLSLTFSLTLIPPSSRSPSHSHPDHVIDHVFTLSAGLVVSTSQAVSVSTGSRAGISPGARKGACGPPALWLACPVLPQPLILHTPSENYHPPDCSSLPLYLAWREGRMEGWMDGEMLK